MKAGAWFLVALALVLPGAIPARAADGDDAARDRRRNLISLQIYADFMYGTDDFFGDYRDAAYADSLRPTPVTPRLPQDAVTGTATTSDGSAKGTGQNTTPGSGDDSTPPDGGGTGDKPPVDELPEDPDPDPGGGCPT